MRDWFSTLAAKSSLPVDAVSNLAERGFVVLPGPVPSEEMNAFVAAYTAAMTSASHEDTRVGTTSTRVNDLVNRGVAFDALYVFPLCWRRAVASSAGRSSSVRCWPGASARSALPRSCTLMLRATSVDWPLVGFILMIDEFRIVNGATRFVPRSHRWLSAPEDVDVRADRADQALACGPAGSLLIFNGSTWHGHAANRSDAPRRSLQGAFIPRDGRAATDFATRMSTATRARLAPLALDVLGV